MGMREEVSLSQRLPDPRRLYATRRDLNPDGVTCTSPICVRPDAKQQGG